MRTDPIEKRLGFGVVARRPGVDDQLAPLGQALEELGYAELWANDGRGRSGLATLRAAAGTSSGLDLGLGVAPLSDKTPGDVAAEVLRLGLPPARLILGLGTGSGSSLVAVRDGVAELRRLVPDARVAVAALGPRMCRLGGEVADVVLLNWAWPDRIVWSRDRIAEGAEAAGRPPPRVAGYVRVAIGNDAVARLVGEADRYRGRPRPYARHFDEQQVTGGHVPGVAVVDPREVSVALAPYRDALDSCVVRALPSGESATELIEIARAAAGR
ncbi:MAG TPA: LLM class flavin-dependent oxidoreductase [Candidatus Limnocylindria bacterium]|nr:LLM class flavin-dependent oxidoreductase [Candidatus Limnocylindria bacterium]